VRRDLTSRYVKKDKRAERAERMFISVHCTCTVQLSSLKPVHLVYLERDVWRGEAFNNLFWDSGLGVGGGPNG
jgi:hypothetical protein